MLSWPTKNYHLSTVKMESTFIFLMCLMAAVYGQLLNPVSTMGMGVGWGTPMWHSGMRYPGMMQTSQVNSMTYPTWRSHPVFRISSVDKNFGAASASDVPAISKPPSTQEVLTHMALSAQSPKPYFDTIADFLYEPQKTRAVITPVLPVPLLTPVNSVGSVASTASKPYSDTASEFLFEPQKVRTVLTPTSSAGSMVSVAPMGTAAPAYMQGVHLVRASTNADDCAQESARWERGMDWLY